MFQRHNAGHSGNKFKEYHDRAAEEHNQVVRENHSLRSDLEKMKAEQEQSLARFQSMHAEAIYQANFEVMRQTEIVKRLTSVINQIIPLLPPDSQANAITMTERARDVKPQDIMQSQMGMGMMPNIFNGFPGPGGLNPAMMAAMGMKPEDALAMMSGKAPMGMMGGMPPNMNAMLAAAAAGSLSIPPPAGGMGMPQGIDDVASRLMNNRPPRSGSGTPNKKPKLEPQNADADAELEIDVQNDDAPSTTLNGRQKDGRDSAQSLSSRDSTTPRSGRNPLSAANSMLPGTPSADMVSSLFANPSSLMQLAAANGRGMDPRFAMNLGTSPSSNGKPAYSFYSKEGSAPQPFSFPDDAFTAPGVPKEMKKVFELAQGEVVCAVTFAPTNDKVFTGGKGCVKLWNIASRENPPVEPTSTFACLGDQYIRSCKLFSDNSWMLVGGEAPNIVIYDTQEDKVVHEFDSNAQACYALAISQDSNMCFSCGADGNVILWDIRQREKLATLSGHVEGASCIDLSADGLTLWTGGLDSTVRSWDIRERRELTKTDLESQAFSLGCSPTSPWVAIGCENHQVDVINTTTNEKYIVHSHESCVLSLRFSRSGKYFVTTGKDNRVHASRSPYGARLVRVNENSSVLSCDITSDDKYLVTGSGDKKATVYEISLTTE